MNTYRQWVTASADRPSISSALAAVKSQARYAAPYGRLALTPEQRSELARKAVQARWAKVKKKRQRPAKTSGA